MAGLDDEFRGEISRYRENGAHEMIVELAANLEKSNQCKAEAVAIDAELQQCLDELEEFDGFVITDKKEIDSVAMLIEKRQWKGTVTIVGFEDSIHRLHQYALQKGVPVNEVAPRARI